MFPIVADGKPSWLEYLNNYQSTIKRVLHIAQQRSVSNSCWLLSFGLSRNKVYNAVVLWKVMRELDASMAETFREVSSYT